MFKNMAGAVPSAGSSFVQSARQHVVHATMTGGGNSFGSLGAGVSGGLGIGTQNHITSIEQLLPVNSPSDMRKLYRSLYQWDNVLGPVVDLMAALPYSDFTLSGLPNADMLRVYATSCEQMRVKAFMPEQLKGYLVDGASLAALNYNQDVKGFTAIVPIDLDWTKTTPLPVFGLDPLFDVSVPPQWKELFKNNRDVRLKDLRALIPDVFEKATGKNQVALDPVATLYLERRGLPSRPGPTSLFDRALPICLLEKTLLQGTLESAQRRQRALMHIMVDDPDVSLTQSQLLDIGNMFQRADLDPLSGAVVTRGGVMTNEVRAGADFWKWDDFYDTASAAKMRAVGTSEAFLSGDASFNTMDNALTVFLENLRATRDYQTRRVFYEKIFPILALDHGFTKTRQSMVLGSARRGSTYRSAQHHEILCASGVPSDLALAEFNAQEYYIPKLNWLKSLRPEADTEYLTILETMSGKGVPVPMRVWAAAGGVNLSELMSGLEDDVALRKKVAAYKARLPKDESADDAGSGGGFEESASARRTPAFEGVEMVDPKSRKPLSVRGRNQLNEKLNARWSKVLATNAQRRNHFEREAQKQNRQRAYFVVPKGFGARNKTGGLS
jgi:hypothetical protein